MLWVGGDKSTDYGEVVYWDKGPSLLGRFSSFTLIKTGDQGERLL